LIGVGAGIVVSDASATEFWAVRFVFIVVVLWLAAFAVYSLWPKLGEPVWWRIGLGALIGALIVSVLFGSIHWVDIRESRNLRKLVPTGVPTPPLPALPPEAVSPDTFVVFFGPSTIRADNLPIGIFSIENKPMLSIELTDDRKSLLVQFSGFLMIRGT
jgi:hypothetical protein